MKVARTHERQRESFLLYGAGGRMAGSGKLSTFGILDLLSSPRSIGQRGRCRPHSNVSGFIGDIGQF